MSDRPIDELIKRLKSDDGLDQVFAAEELGERCAPAAVLPLIQALDGLKYRSGADFGFARAIIQALSKLGDDRAIEPILNALRKTPGDDVIPGEACHALALLRATAVVPELETLLQNKKYFDNAEELVEALVELGGQNEGPFFQGLLSTRNETVKVAAIEAIGSLRYVPAAPILSKLRKANSEEIRFAALGALIGIGAPGAEVELEEEMGQAPNSFMKSLILRLISRQLIKGAVPLLLSKAEDPSWANSEQILIETLGVAAGLGSEVALSRLNALAGDRAMSPCTRAGAAALMLDLGQTQHLETCLDFIRRNGGHLENDERDSFTRANGTQTAVVESLERLAHKHEKLLLPIVDLFDTVRRGKHGNPPFIEVRSGQAIRALTGTERFSEFELWRSGR